MRTSVPQSFGIGREGVTLKKVILRRFGRGKIGGAPAHLNTTKSTSRPDRPTCPTFQEAFTSCIHWAPNSVKHTIRQHTGPTCEEVGPVNLISGCSALYGMSPATREDSSALCSAQSCLFFAEFESSNLWNLDLNTYLSSSCSLSNEIIITCIVRGQGNNIKEVTLASDYTFLCIVSRLKTHRESGVLVHLLNPTLSWLEFITS